MAHRQEAFSLVVLSRWSPSVGLARSAPRGPASGCYMKHATPLRAVRFV